MIPHLVDEKVFSRTILVNKKPVGYLWFVEENQKDVYLLFFYLGKTFRRQRVASQAMEQFYLFCRQMGKKRLRLLVSTLNHAGLSFWVKQGFDRISLVEGADDGMPTKAVELELEKRL